MDIDSLDVLPRSLSVEPALTLERPKLPVTAPSVRSLALILDRLLTWLWLVTIGMKGYPYFYSNLISSE